MRCEVFTVVKIHIYCFVGYDHLICCVGASILEEHNCPCVEDSR
jgi:hypothetical protein